MNTPSFTCKPPRPFRPRYISESPRGTKKNNPGRKTTLLCALYRIYLRTQNPCASSRLTTHPDFHIFGTPRQGALSLLKALRELRGRRSWRRHHNKRTMVGGTCMTYVTRHRDWVTSLIQKNTVWQGHAKTRDVVHERRPPGGGQRQPRHTEGA